MLNIAIVEYCNLKCPYCFESEYQNNNNYITLENFNNILSFLTKEKNKTFSLMGGEPTLHPRFDEILKRSAEFCEEYHSTSFLFTNGTNLLKYIDKIPLQMGLVINYNPIEEVGLNNFQKTYDIINYCLSNKNYQEKTIIGINIHLNRSNYDYVWDMVKHFGLKKLRCSITSPGRDYHNYYNNSTEYFKKIKPIFIDFIKHAKQYGVTLARDCGYIPLCFFNKEEKELIYSVCGKSYYTYCTGYSADVFTDLTVSFCFACENKYNLLDFNNVEELYKILIQEQQNKKLKQRKIPRCKKCKEKNKCHQGCLSFTQ